ncbi:MAG: M28 family peptidase [Candidatus Heimdallarchaeota archaeon]|nr:MAG: M28 family peptidase [Candidatus Heimdallarchaeota archaeon]
MSMIKDAIETVDINNLYTHILSLEGVKHALDSYDILIQAGKYIERSLQQHDITTNRHFFSVEGIDEDFFNVEGFLEDHMDLSEPTIFITNHYDTIYSTPGADDNASGVAVMLEVARVLREINFKKNVIFVSFNLEEFSPSLQNPIRKIGTECGVFDENYRYISWPLKKFADQFKKLIISSGPAKPFLDEDEWNKFEAQAKVELTNNELKFFREQNRIFRESAQDDPFGRSFCLGSDAYSKYIIEKEMNITGVINLESIGFTSKEPYSQRLPKGITLDMFKTYRTDHDRMIGNYITIIGDENSQILTDSFFNSSQHDLIKLPCACLDVPLDYDGIKQTMPDLLRSDHAPFWRVGIPAIIVTDTANFRNPYYHTAGDTINTLDFIFMKKICQTTLSTIINLFQLG